VNTGIVAAGRQQSLIDSRDYSHDLHPEALDVGTDSFNAADDEPFDPTGFIDEDDEF
jgi:hypothetical protein